MKKKLLMLLLVLIMPVMVLAGCNDSKTIEIGEQCKVGSATLIKVEDNGTFAIFVHKETKVMYLLNTEYYRYGITVMLNADGTPMLWEGEL
jgi:hypothetical protein